MKDKSKKSTYSTTFGVDPIYLREFTGICAAIPQKIKAFRVESLYFSVAVQAGIEPATK